MSNVNEIKKLQEGGKLIIGTDRTLKNLKTGKTGKIFLCSNPSKELKEDIEHYASIADVEVVHLDIPNNELGVICKKTFSIAVLSTLK